MIPPAFEYMAPTSLEEVLALLGEHGDEAKILSGGMSLIPAMKLRLASPAILLDINNVPGMEYIRVEDGVLCVGAMTREAAFERSPLTKFGYPILFETAKVIADPIVRNRATIGGNLAHADPANDHPATMLAVDATVIAHSAHGTRAIPIADFFTDFFATCLSHDEILTEIRIPMPVGRSGSAYIKFERKVGDYAIAAIAVTLTLDSRDICTSARIGLTNVSSIPMRATGAEAALIGQRLTPEAIRDASRHAASECDPRSDLRGSEEYKRDMVRVLTVRTVEKAHARALAGAH